MICNVRLESDAVHYFIIVVQRDSDLLTFYFGHLLISSQTGNTNNQEVSFDNGWKCEKCIRFIADTRQRQMCRLRAEWYVER